MSEVIEMLDKSGKFLLSYGGKVLPINASSIMINLLLNVNPLPGDLGGFNLKK